AARHLRRCRRLRGAGTWRVTWRDLLRGSGFGAAADRGEHLGGRVGGGVDLLRRRRVERRRRGEPTLALLTLAGLLGLRLRGDDLGGRLVVGAGLDHLGRRFVVLVLRL